MTKAEVLDGPPATDPARFTGPVTQLAIHSVTKPEPMRVITVHFSDGARTHWHAHAGGQVLHVIEGDGRVQSWGGEVHSIGPGDTVSAEPGEKHWHGAARGTSMAHLAVSIGAVTWMEPPDE
jgi:quercetin dioxygenase-like cupin family protein